MKTKKGKGDGGSTKMGIVKI